MNDMGDWWNTVSSERKQEVRTEAERLAAAIGMDVERMERAIVTGLYQRKQDVIAGGEDAPSTATFSDEEAIE